MFFSVSSRELKGNVENKIGNNTLQMSPTRLKLWMFLFMDMP